MIFTICYRRACLQMALWPRPGTPAASNTRPKPCLVAAR